MQFIRHSIIQSKCLAHELQGLRQQVILRLSAATEKLARVTTVLTITLITPAD